MHVPSMHHQPPSHALVLQGVPEDLLFFYRSIRQGGGAFRVDRCLLVYRYHEKAATHSVSESVQTHAHMRGYMPINKESSDAHNTMNIHLLTAVH